MSRLAITACIIVAFCGPSWAINRYDSTSMSCAKARSLVDDQGAVIFRYPSARKPGLILYDRFVRNSGYCDVQQVAERMSIPTAGGTKCALLHCVARIDDLFPKPNPPLANFGAPF